MKRDERDKAKALRSQGLSLGVIAKRLGVSKSSVSFWVRNIPLTRLQRKRLNENGFSIDAIEKRRLRRINNTKALHQEIMNTAGNELGMLSQRDLWMLGIGLYWGEGGKTHRGSVRLSNSDPAVIQFMMVFFKVVCGVKDTKFRAHIHTFSHLNVKRCEEFWSKITGIPLNRFYKTYSKPSRASKHKKDNLPYGTLQIYVHDTKLFLRIMGWIRAVNT